MAFAWPGVCMTWKRYGAAILVTLLCGGLTELQAASRQPASKARHNTHHKSAPAPRKLKLCSASVLVLDQRTGESLVEKKPGVVLPIASITKLMSAMVLVDAQLDMAEFVTIDVEDRDEIRHSKSHLPIGIRLSRDQALLLALMASENRAINALGRTFPGGLPAFVAAMNAKAKSLGLQDTHFQDPAGLDIGNVSSALDLARLVNAAYQYPCIRQYSTCREMTIQSGRRKLTFVNTNALVRNPRWHIGLSKTGYIEEAGRCLVMQAQFSQRPVLIILLDSWGKNTRLGDANRIKQWMEGPEASRRQNRG